MKDLNFANNLKAILEATNKTQQELADYLGTTQQTISRWIYGINEPDFATLFKICEFFNETPNTILGFED